MTCRVAYDFESNFFWRAMGYSPTGIATSTWLNQRQSKSKRPLIVYVKDFAPLFSYAGVELLPGQRDVLVTPDEIASSPLLAVKEQ